MTERHSDDLLDGFGVEQAAVPGGSQPAAGAGAGRVAEAWPDADRPTADRLSEPPGVQGVAVVAAESPAGDGYVSVLLDTLVERRSSVDRAEADVLALVMDFADACPADGDTVLLDGPPAVVDETAIVELGARLGMSHRSAANLVTEAVELRDRLPRLWALVQQGRLQAWKARQVARVTPSLSDAAAQFVDAHAAVTARRNQLPDLRKLVIMAINRCDPDLAEGLEEAALAERGVTFAFSTSTDSTATARLEATLDLLDALDLDATISHLATEMGRLGDDAPLDVRRAHALGSLANPQRTLELFGDPVEPTIDDAIAPAATDAAADTADDTADDTAADDTAADDAAAKAASSTAADTTDAPATDAPSHSRPAEDTTDAPATDAPSHSSTAAHEPAEDVAPAPGAARSATRSPARLRMPKAGQPRWNRQIGHVYLHLDAADLRALLADGLLPGPLGAGAGGVDLERLGAASLRLVRDWLGGVSRVSVRPVLDLAADDPVDQHDPPEAMREQVMLRDGLCVFPGCRTHARACDLDHIDPYIPLDEGGPPGQTHPGNLACLCRRHHRMKTHHGWHYHRTRDGTYRWTDPHGASHTTASMPMYPARPHAA